MSPAPRRLWKTWRSEGAADLLEGANVKTFVENLSEEIPCVLGDAEVPSRARMALRKLEVVDLTSRPGRQRYEDLVNNGQISVLRTDDFLSTEGDRETGFTAVIRRIVEYRDRGVSPAPDLSGQSAVYAAPIC